MVQYFFYKNVACFTNQLFYAFYTNFSAQSLFDDFNLPSFNMLYTAVPIFIFSFLARNHSEARLLQLPGLYTRVAHNALLSAPELVAWFLQGLWHSATVFFGWALYWEGGGGAGGRSLGLCVYTTLVLVVSAKLLLHTRALGWQLLLSVLGSGLAFVLLNLAASSPLLGPGLGLGDPGMLAVAAAVFSAPAVWGRALLLAVLALLPDVVLRVVRKHWTRHKAPDSGGVESQRGRYRVGPATGVRMEPVSGSPE